MLTDCVNMYFIVQPGLFCTVNIFSDRIIHFNVGFVHASHAIFFFFYILDVNRRYFFSQYCRQFDAISYQSYLVLLKCCFDFYSLIRGALLIFLCPESEVFVLFNDCTC